MVAIFDVLISVLKKIGILELDGMYISLKKKYEYGQQQTESLKQFVRFLVLARRSKAVKSFMQTFSR